MGVRLLTGTPGDALAESFLPVSRNVSLFAGQEVSLPKDGVFSPRIYTDDSIELEVKIASQPL